MTKADLAGLLAERTAALDDLTGLEHAPLRDLAPSQQLRAYIASEVFRSTDRRIVAELKALGEPADLGDVVLHLTRDRLNFLELDPETRRPLYVTPSDRTSWRSILYRYPSLARQNRPESMP